MRCLEFRRLLGRQRVATGQRPFGPSQGRRSPRSGRSRRSWSAGAPGRAGVGQGPVPCGDVGVNRPSHGPPGGHGFPTSCRRGGRWSAGALLGPESAKVRQFTGDLGARSPPDAPDARDAPRRACRSLPQHAGACRACRGPERAKIRQLARILAHGRPPERTHPPGDTRRPQPPNPRNPSDGRHLQDRRRGAYSVERGAGNRPLAGQVGDHDDRHRPAVLSEHQAGRRLG